MTNKFAQIAQDATVLCPLMAGKVKLETEEVLDQEYTIVAFDFAPKFDKKGDAIVDESTGEPDVFGVVVFEEEPEKYYCVGTVFTKVCKAWAAGYDTPYDASVDLASEGGVRVRFRASKTKKGNNLIAVDILG